MFAGAVVCKTYISPEDLYCVALRHLNKYHNLNSIYTTYKIAGFDVKAVVSYLVRIKIVSYVDKIITTSTMVLDF